MRTRLLAPALVAVLALGLAACSDDDSGSSGENGTSIEVTSAAPGATEEKNYVPAGQDGSCPDDHPVKVVDDASRGGRIYATPGGKQYDQIRAGFCFDTAENAEAKDFEEFD